MAIMPMGLEGFMKNNARLGFTLAEVLVTLGIIGVIAAMTVPTLMKNHQRKVYVTQIQKVYNEVQQAFERAITDKNAVNIKEAGLIEGAEGTFLKTYFNISKDCGKSDTTCFASDYRMLNYPNSANYLVSNKYKVVLTSGVSMALDFGHAYWTGGGDNENTRVGHFVVDINGLQGPNLVCRDMFVIDFLVDGTVSSSNNCIGRLMKNGWVMDEEYDRQAGSY